MSANAHTILVVDDELLIRETLFMLLSKQGYEVLLAANGEEAVDIIRDNYDIDLVLTDMLMPGIDGLELIKISKHYRPELLCVVITGHGDMDNAIAAMQAGAFNYVLKPIDIKLIESVIQQAIEKSQMQEQIKFQQAQLVHAGRLTAMGEMAAGIAHELNQPLNIISITSSMLRMFLRDKLPNELSAELYEKFKDSVEFDIPNKLDSQVSRATKIINSMRSFARDDKTVTLAMDLTSPIEGSISFFRSQFKSHGIKFVEKIDKQLPLVMADGQRFEQIMVNFLSNAKHAVEGKMVSKSDDQKYEMLIELTAASKGDNFVVEVKDNGYGMSEEVVKKCTQPFFTTKEIGEGTGLGLSIVHGIIKEFNGVLGIESEVNVGTTMRLVLPIYSK